MNLKLLISRWTPNNPVPSRGSFLGGQLSGSVSNLFSNPNNSLLTLLPNFTAIHVYPRLKSAILSSLETNLVTLGRSTFFLSVIKTQLLSVAYFALSS